MSSIASCPFPDSPCSGCVPVSSVAMPGKGSPFQGFSPPFASRNRLQRLRATRPNLGLAPVLAQIAESQRTISEYRRRSRDRIQNLSKLSFRRCASSTPVVSSSVETVVHSFSLGNADSVVTAPAVCAQTPSRPFTRSQGPVADIENVQSRILEYKIQKS